MAVVAAVSPSLEDVLRAMVDPPRPTILVTGIAVGCWTTAPVGAGCWTMVPVGATSVLASLATPERALEPLFASEEAEEDGGEVEAEESAADAVLAKLEEATASRAIEGSSPADDADDVDDDVDADTAARVCMDFACISSICCCHSRFCCCFSVNGAPVLEFARGAEAVAVAEEDGGSPDVVEAIAGAVLVMGMFSRVFEEEAVVVDEDDESLALNRLPLAASPLLFAPLAAVVVAAAGVAVAAGVGARRAPETGLERRPDDSSSGFERGVVVVAELALEPSDEEDEEDEEEEDDDVVEADAVAELLIFGNMTGGRAVGRSNPAETAGCPANTADDDSDVNDGMVVIEAAVDGDGGDPAVNEGREDVVRVVDTKAATPASSSVSSAWPVSRGFALAPIEDEDDEDDAEEEEAEVEVEDNDVDRGDVACPETADVSESDTLLVAR